MRQETIITGNNISSQITSVFNQNPLENKVFKALNLETDSPWSVNMQRQIFRMTGI